MIPVKDIKMSISNYHIIFYPSAKNKNRSSDTDESNWSTKKLNENVKCSGRRKIIFKKNSWP